jgi:hypothetical protein
MSIETATGTIHGTARGYEDVRDAFRDKPFLGPGSFAFTGAGGDIGLGDVGRRVGFAYTMTAMFGNLTGDPRPRAVMDALDGCLR